MPRVKRSVHAQKKRRKVLEQAKGYWGFKHTHYRYAKEQVEHSLVYAYRDRKNKKRTFRRLWITRINAAARDARAVVQPVRPRLRQGRASSSTARCSPTSRSATRPRSARSPSRPRPRSKPSQPDHLTRQRAAQARPQAPRPALARQARAVRRRGRGSRRGGGDAGSSRSSCSSPARRRAGAARRGLDARAPAARDRASTGATDLPRGARPVTLALWHVADPGNVGTLLRSADAFGAGVALSAGCADPTGPKALRASMGAVFRVPIGGVRRAGGDARSRSSRAAAMPLPEVDARRRRRLRARRRAGGPAEGRARALRRPGVDPAAGRRGVAQRRDGRHGRAVRARPPRLSRRLEVSDTPGTLVA